MPKGMKRSKRSKYLGSFTIHYITLCLVRNIQTGNISPQFHLVFDDYFETVHVGYDQEPPVWSELITFQYVESVYDDEDYVTSLSD